MLDRHRHRHRRSYDASEEGRSVEAETALEEMEEAEEEEREVEEARGLHSRSCCCWTA